MDEKPAAGLITAIIIAPLVALCCLGPVFIASAAAGVAGWLSGRSLVLAAVLALLAAAIGYAVTRWRPNSSRRRNAGPTCACDEPKARQADELDPVGLADERRGRSQHACQSDTRVVARPNQTTIR